ncbi:probable phospholipid-transporting ATPase IM [Amphiura filiformis]|uniref:probable phospholipid-transporting ATPase IM n=1 Tax=Amphiura filiformis TaxID=82378 RepID=UPI003B223CC2
MGKTETERVLKANDREFNVQFKYANNYIRTSKYTLITFFPRNLFEQFMRIANTYFLVLLILQLLPVISSLSYITTALPLIFVLAVTAIKDGVDDIKRHRSDNQVNNRKSDILVDGELMSTKWQHVQVGDIIRMENNEFIAADIMLLSSSEPHSLVYVETAELDGETNLKVRQAIPETAVMGEDIEKLKQFNADVRCEAPNNKLDKFEGTLTWAEEKFPVSNDQILLRGCRLRNTKWCYGITIFSGRDTKLMQNSGKSKFKRTSIDRLMNKLVISIFFFQFVLCAIVAIACSIWESNYGDEYQIYLPWDFKNPAIIATLVFFSYFILFNTLVPISLYVSVELIRLFQSFWINWDRQMYYDVNDTPAKARSTTLNEELGQIQYVFSDKTGTLTQNMMTFNKCTIGGRKFGEVKNDDGDILDITEDTPLVDFSANKDYEPSFKFYDQTLLDAIEKGDRNCWLFFRLLALCHTVMPERNEDGKKWGIQILEYQAQSPDEGALVGAARNFGFVFKSRTPTTITIDVQGAEDQYELLHILDFNNVRKRMSVVVRQGHRIKLFCKGADTVIMERLCESSGHLKESTNVHLNEFANEGLRTLCLAMKDITEDYYLEWRKRFKEAATSLDDREGKLDEVYEEIEQDLVLLGATAVEDKLQDGVPETIENLHKADIKLWVLTGDKQETAINIGYSCRLLTEDFNEVFVLDANTEEEAKESVVNALHKIRETVGIKGKDELEGVDEDEISVQSKDFDDVKDVYSFALIVTGACLAYALDPTVEEIFLEAACYCKTVICCRVTPLQKAQVVDLVKRHKKAVTLAIGDGANDVSMIKAAHIGIGISGQEGMQAVLSSDFSFAQFRFLERLLLVHGRWSYYRLCKFMAYFFYKNFAFTLMHFWFAFFCGFSAMSVYDEWFITVYNIFFTSMPVLSMGIFDKDVSEKMCIRFPELYKPGQENKFFNYYVFGSSLFQGAVTSIVIFFIPYGAFAEDIYPDGLSAQAQTLFGCMLATILIFVVNFKIALDTSTWNVFSHILTWGSILFYWLFIFLVYCDPLYPIFNAAFTYVGSATMMSHLPTFWFALILVITILILPVAGKRSILSDITPTLTDKVRILEREEKKKQKKQAVELKGIRRPGAVRPGSIRRDSHRRGSKRPASARSGYAFAHQHGFGDMILSGVNMRIKKDKENGKNGSPAESNNKRNGGRKGSNERNADTRLKSSVSSGGVDIKV